MQDEQIKLFITKSREKGIRDEDIVTYLKGKGVDLAKQSQPQSFTGSSKATFEATGNENLITGGLKALGNLPRSSYELGKNVVQAVTSPIETTKAIGGLVQGAGAKVGEAVLENTDFGQSLLQKAKERGVAVETDATTGKLITKPTPELEQFNSVLKFFGDRYGSIDKFKETAIEDPAGVLADLATVMTGGGAALSKAGQISKVAPISKAGEVMSATAQSIEPIAATTKMIGKTVGAPVKVVGSILPDGKNLQAGEIVKALELTQGDLQKITKSSGNNASDFIAQRNLIRNTPDETVFALKDVKDSTMKLVRDEIAKVSKTYSQKDIPTIKSGMEVILKGVDETPGLEDVAGEIRGLLSKENYTLSDIQRAKELIDQNSDIYSKFGDVKASSQSRGLDNIRKDIRSFIEKEVDTATGGQTNIRQLNNDVQTAKEISDAIINRQQRALTRQNVSLSDMVILVGGLATDPITGIAVLAGKKALENPAFRLGLAKALQKQPIKAVQKALEEVKNKTVSKESQALIKRIVDEANTALPVAESGAAILEESKVDNQTTN